MAPTVEETPAAGAAVATAPEVIKEKKEDTTDAGGAKDAKK
jgi:hypothetical protein